MLTSLFSQVYHTINLRALVPSVVRTKAVRNGGLTARRAVVRDGEYGQLEVAITTYLERSSGVGGGLPTTYLLLQAFRQRSMLEKSFGEASGEVDVIIPVQRESAWMPDILF